MGCDIHWIAERRDSAGRWHAVASKSHWYSNDDLFVAGAYEQRAKLPESRLSERDYDLFAELSSVRGAPSRRQIAQNGLPEDASVETRSEAKSWGYDGHSWGVVGGAEITTLSATAKHPSLKAWCQAARALIGTQPEILPPSHLDEDQGERIWGGETAHERVERIACSQTLANPSLDPTSWRFIVFYDN